MAGQKRTLPHDSQHAAKRVLTQTALTDFGQKAPETNAENGVIVLDDDDEDEEVSLSHPASEAQTKQVYGTPQAIQLTHNVDATFTIQPPAFDLETTFVDHAPRLIVRPPDLDLALYKPFMHSSGRKALFHYLLSELPWYRVKYMVRGMNVVTPRFTTVWGRDETLSPLTKYRKLPRPIPHVLAALKAHVEALCGARFNFVLCNFYADGKDSISYHSDDESFLGPEPTIASISLGGSRDFYLKHKEDKEKQEKFVLDDGDLLIMRGKTQEKWLHAIPKRARAQPRINLTFRKAINIKGTDNYYRYNVGEGSIYRYKNGVMVETSSGVGGTVPVIAG